MRSKSNVNCYCFNINCKNSIHNHKTCVPVSLPLEHVLTQSFGCAECGSELLSPFLINIKTEISSILNTDNKNLVAILDDDLIYHQTIKIMLKKHDKLRAEFYQDGRIFLDELEKGLKNEHELPGIIFLDINMPLMSGWEFLYHFQEFNDKLTNRIAVYIVSDSLDPNDYELSKKYPFVKSFITKPLTRHFLLQVNQDLSNSN